MLQGELIKTGIFGLDQIFFESNTFASLLLHRAPPSRGVLMYIQHQMGHASLEITINTYAHLIDDLGTRLVDLLPGADDAVPVPDDASTAGEGGHE